MLKDYGIFSAFTKCDLTHFFYLPLVFYHKGKLADLYTCTCRHTSKNMSYKTITSGYHKITEG